MSTRASTMSAVSAALRPRAEPSPALLSPHTPRAIRDALVGSERADFEHAYQWAMTEAGGTLDLTEVLSVLEVYRELAELTGRHGPEAHRRMLDVVARLQRGQDVPVIAGGSAQGRDQREAEPLIGCTPTTSFRRHVSTWTGCP